MTHTPGPWKSHPAYREHKFDIYAGNDDYLGYAVNEDDARLIAAAPDLLASLKEIKMLLSAGDYAICRVDGQKMGLGDLLIVGDVLERGTSAIAKAEEE